MADEEVFPGFWHPNNSEGFSKMPHELIDRLDKIESLSELKVILYIMRHTWGFQEFERGKKITTDEFMHGRKRADGSRMDNGTGLSDWGVKDGIAKAIKHGYVLCETDTKDKARIKKYYKINIYIDPKEPR